MARKPGLPKLTKQNMEDAPEETRWVESIKLTVNNTVEQVEQLRSSTEGIKLLENADVELHEISVQIPDPWIEITTFANGWSNNDGNYYMKDPDGTVFLRYSLLGGGAGADAFSMPVGYRPKNSISAYGVSAAPNIVSIAVAGGFNVTTAADVDGYIAYQSSDSTPVPLSCWPQTIQTKLKKVVGVIVADVRDDNTSKPLPAGCVYHPVWETTTMGGSLNVKVLNIAGLPYNRKSLVKLLFVGG